MYLAWVLLKLAPSLHNKCRNDTAYSQQEIVYFALPAIDKRLLGASQSL